MAGIALQSRGGAPRRRRRAGQSGQVLLDALVATALLAVALPTFTETARGLMHRAQERHEQVLHIIETENGFATGRQPPPAG